MKTKKKYLIIFMLLAMLILIIKPSTVQAALQSNGGTVKTYNLNDWMINIRNMQASGGTLGLSDTINTDLTSTNTNLDIHMEKNTEYGAMAILSASSYGNPEVIASGGTTTGNKTGIVININHEWTATGYIELGNNVANFKNALGRYKNIYTGTYSPKIGDAIEETKGWHGSNEFYWINSSVNSGLVRATSKSLFSYYGLTHESGERANYGQKYASRAVIVVGTGI